MRRPVLLAIALAIFPFEAGCRTSSNAGAADATADGPNDTAPDAAAPAPCTDTSVQPIQASDYDQLCSVNAECVAVGEGNACDPCTAGCYNAAINFRALPQYMSNFPKTSSQSGATCACPAQFFSCCRNGVCHADLQCQNALAEASTAEDTGDAAMEGGAPDTGADAGTDASADAGTDAGADADASIDGGLGDAGTD